MGRQDFKKISIIKLKIFGKDTGSIGKDLKEIQKKYSEKAIIHFSRELESVDMEKKIELLRGLREKKLSIEEMGLKILGDNLKKLNFGSSFDGESVFRLLSEGETEKAFSILSGQQKTLNQLIKSE